MRISDWSSDVCSSDLHDGPDGGLHYGDRPAGGRAGSTNRAVPRSQPEPAVRAVQPAGPAGRHPGISEDRPDPDAAGLGTEESRRRRRSEEHTSELQSLMRNTYAVFCLKKKTITNFKQNPTNK